MRRILWAEDSPDDQTLIREALRQMPDPPAVEFVEDGAALLEKLDAAKPGLLVVDLSMPGMSGMETLEQLKERGAPTRVGIIVFTAHGGKGEARHCRNHGAHDVIEKPTDFVEFVFAVQRICRHAAWTVADNAASPSIHPLTPT